MKLFIASVLLSAAVTSGRATSQCEATFDCYKLKESTIERRVQAFHFGAQSPKTIHFIAEQLPE
jgi:hypothetical protein